VPDQKQVRAGTLRQILNAAGMTVEQCWIYAEQRILPGKRRSFE